MTVTDPRHPLYGQTFELVSIEKRKDRGHVCLVLREWGQNSYLPIEVTDRMTSASRQLSLPLTVHTIQQLVKIYGFLVESQSDATENSKSKQGSNARSKRAGKSSKTKSHLVVSERHPTATSAAQTRTDLSGTGTTTAEPEGNNR